MPQTRADSTAHHGESDKASAHIGSVLPTEHEMRDYLARRYGNPMDHGWRVRRRHQFGYVSPELWYEATVDKLVTDRTTWIDVGGGKAIFPHDEDLSRDISDRCEYLAGVDPSENILQNPFVDERNQCMIEDYRTERQFDLATLRMVVEHIQEPDKAVDSLSPIGKTRRPCRRLHAEPMVALLSRGFRYASSDPRIRHALFMACERRRCVSNRLQNEHENRPKHRLLAERVPGGRICETGFLQYRATHANHSARRTGNLARVQVASIRLSRIESDRNLPAVLEKSIWQLNALETSSASID